MAWIMLTAFIQIFNEKKEKNSRAGIFEKSYILAKEGMAAEDII